MDEKNIGIGLFIAAGLGAAYLLTKTPAAVTPVVVPTIPTPCVSPNQQYRFLTNMQVSSTTGVVKNYLAGDIICGQYNEPSLDDTAPEPAAIDLSYGASTSMLIGLGQPSIQWMDGGMTYSVSGGAVNSLQAVGGGVTTSTTNQMPAAANVATLSVSADGSQLYLNNPLSAIPSQVVSPLQSPVTLPNIQGQWVYCPSTIGNNGGGDAPMLIPAHWQFKPNAPIQLIAAAPLPNPVNYTNLPIGMHAQGLIINPDGSAYMIQPNGMGVAYVNTQIPTSLPNNTPYTYNGVAGWIAYNGVLYTTPAILANYQRMYSVEFTGKGYYPPNSGWA